MKIRTQIKKNIMKKLVFLVAGIIFVLLFTSCLSEFTGEEMSNIAIKKEIQEGRTFKIHLKTRRDTFDPHDREKLETDPDSTSSANASTESVSPAEGENTDVKENKDATTPEQTTEEDCD